MSAGIRSFALAGSLVLGVAASTLLPVAQGLAAQSARENDAQPPATKPAGDRRFRYLLAGVAVGGLLAYGYYEMSDRGKQSGRCMPVNCALPFLTISGGISGLFLSKELAAQRRSEQPRAGAALTFTYNAIPLLASARSLAVRDSLVVAATDSGAQLISASPRPTGLRRRGAGLSNLRSVAIGGSDARLLLGTGTALWETPSTSGLLTRVMDGAVDALSANADVVVAAFGSKVRVRHTVNSIARIDSVSAPARITSSRFDPASGTWWLTGDSLLLQLTVTDTAPLLVERARFHGQARAVATSTSWVAVALGSDGLAIWPRASLGGAGVVTPMLMRGEPRFAFDIAFVGERLFVAGGVDGVTEVAMTSGARVVGSSRQAGYATTIASDNAVLWVGDSGSNRVLRIVP